MRWLNRILVAFPITRKQLPLLVNYFCVFVVKLSYIVLKWIWPTDMVWPISNNTFRYITVICSITLATFSNYNSKTKDILSKSISLFFLVGYAIWFKSIQAQQVDHKTSSFARSLRDIMHWSSRSRLPMWFKWPRSSYTHTKSLHLSLRWKRQPIFCLDTFFTWSL